MNAEGGEDRLEQLGRVVHQYVEELGEKAAVRIREDLDSLLPSQSVAKATEPSRYDKLFPDMVGRSAPMRALFDLVLKVAPTDTTVLIFGESGTGKELVARSIHRLSKRNAKPFVAENCAALPETLLESELFGHTRGAFTGADRNRKGRFAAADTGTLFLDEVGDMSPGLQKKLLRTLQEGEIRPVGASRVQKVDVRFLSASNRDLAELVEQGKFREDLYWRLSPIRIDIPPLRERSADVPLLIEHFASEVAGKMGREAPRFTDEAMQALSKHRWPGNVRELQNEVQRTLALSTPGQPIEVADLSPDVAGA